MRPRDLHLVPDTPPTSQGPLSARGDLGLIAFLLAVHAVVLVGFFLGIGWGDAVGGYATAVVLVAGRELVHELARRFWSSDGSPRS